MVQPKLPNQKSKTAVTRPASSPCERTAHGLTADVADAAGGHEAREAGAHGRREDLQRPVSLLRGEKGRVAT